MRSALAILDNFGHAARHDVPLIQSIRNVLGPQGVSARIPPPLQALTLIAVIESPASKIAPTPIQPPLDFVVRIRCAAVG
jgi:hypothetical protein